MHAVPGSMLEARARPRTSSECKANVNFLQLLSDAASYTTSIDIPVNGVMGSEYQPRVFETMTDDLGSLLAVTLVVRL